MKPGYKTTEFWLSLLATIGGFVVAIVQILAPERVGQAQTALDELVKLVGIVAPLVLPLLISREYLTARMSLKFHQADEGK